MKLSRLREIIKEEYRTAHGSKWLVERPTIIPLTEEAAKEWAEDNLNTTEYINIFGPISE